MAVRRSIKIDPKTNMVTINLNIEQAGVLADAMRYANACAEDNFGSGWEAMGDKADQGRKEWQQSQTIEQMVCQRLIKHHDKVARA